ncbi:MAG TPA: hypothetical protein VLX68_17370 [Chitinivibrionales bacterium]|nr:hypothetical protein [Chitinivibrionales bacterium]
MSLKKIVTVAAALIVLAGCGNPFMLKIETKPDMHANASKAALVIYRSTSFGPRMPVHNFIDGKYIGTTVGKCFFISKVDPGSRYVVGDAENKACAKINFEAGKVYYLQQILYFGFKSARTGYSGSNPKDFEDQLKEGMDYIAINPAEKAPMLNEGDYKQTIADFEREDKEDPSKHKDTDSLQGY